MSLEAIWNRAWKCLLVISMTLLLGHGIAMAKAVQLSPPQFDDNTEQMDIYGVILDVKNTQQTVPGSGLTNVTGEAERIQKVTVRLDLEEPISGLNTKVITVENVLGENPAYNIPLRPGSRVLLNMERATPKDNWHFYIANRDRTPAIFILGATTIMALLLIGGVEVTKHLLLVVLMLFACHKFLFPSILKEGTGLLWLGFMSLAYVLLGSWIYQTPEQPKRTLNKVQSIVILSTLGGLCILLGIIWIMHGIAPLDGYTSEAMAALWYRSPKLDYWALYMATILLGYQGFIFYLCWMLAQNRRQPDGEHEEQLNFVQRFNIGMLRGRRLLGPLVSSLGLLFLGLYLPILLQLQGTSGAQFINLESTVSMLTIAFAGGLTLVLTVPLTALVSAWVMTQKDS